MERPRIMASLEQNKSRSRDAAQSASARLYKFALVLTVNEELARALFRSALKVLNTRNETPDEDRDHFIGAYRRMYALWSAKLAENPDIQKKCPPDSRVFAALLAKGPFAGNAHFAKFVAAMPSQQRAALYLVYGECASYDEAAEAITLDLPAVMKLLARGHLALAQWLDHRGLADGEGRREAGYDHSPGRERAA
jgi:RNA polymerase sigma-70 factor (ECF subfamily)